MSGSDAMLLPGGAATTSLAQYQRATIPQIAAPPAVAAAEVYIIPDDREERVLLHLIAAGRLKPGAIEQAVAVSEDSGASLWTTLVRLGAVAERDVALAFSETLALPLANLADFVPEAIQGAPISIGFLREFHVLPIGIDASGIQVAMANPLDDYAAHAIALFSGKSVSRLIGTPSDIDGVLDRIYADSSKGLGEETNQPALDEFDRLKDLASDAPVIRLVNQIIVNAIESRASDIHIEPAAERVILRYRVDGVMREIEPPPPRLREAVVSRVKILAQLNIAEQRLPQDGRMSQTVRGTKIDFRVSTIPTVHGESVVIRVLDQDHVSLDFAALGFDERALAEFSRALALPHGILLVTGPTGSGKTTTLYAALAALNSPERKIMTIEDPVEYQLDRVVQVQVQTQIGLTFARALRAFLRQNPNIVMVGEIRDLETAQVAVQAALTGHMILSTLHTNDAASGVTRLLDMGIEDYLLVSTVNAILAQRLVRTLCSGCRKPYEVSAEVAASFGLPGHAPATFYRACGCAACEGQGFRGRTTILEILPMTDAIRQLALARASAGDIMRAAINGGMRTMQAHGLEKALAGITTIEEVLRVTREA